MDSSFSGSYRDVIDNMDLALVIYRAVDDGDDFVFVEVNSGVEEIEQVKRENLIGRKVTEAFPGVEEFGLLDVLRRVYRTGVPERFPVSMYTDNRITGWRDNYVYRLETGEIVAIYRDETERKRQEEYIEYLYQVLISIRNVNQLIVTEKDRETLLQRICEVMVDSKGYNGAWIGLTDPSGDVESVFGAGFDPVRFNEFKNVVGNIAVPCLTQVWSPGVHVIDDVVDACVGCPLQADDIGSTVLHASLIHEGRLYGLMMVSVPKSMVRREEMELFEEVINDISYALYGLEVEKERKRAEEARRISLEKLQASEMLLSQSQEIAHIGSWSLDLKTYQLTWSDEVYRIFGYAPQEFEGTYEAFLEAVHPEDREMVDKAFMSSVEDNQSYEVVHRVLRPDGSVRWVRERSMNITDESGVPVQSIGMVHDITEQYNAEVDLRSSELRSRLFRESATDGFMILDNDLRYIEVNDSWLQQSGLEREDVIGKHVLEVFPKLKETGRYDDYLRVIETGESIDFHAVEAVSGQGLILDLSVFKVGDVLGLVAKDVSDRVRYQRRLEALHSHAASMSSAESIEQISYITCDSIYGVIGHNRGSFGLVEESVLNHKYRWGIDSTEEFKMPLTGPGITVEVVNTGESIRIGSVDETKLYVDGAGDPITFSELAVPVKVSGKVVAVINIESEKRDAFNENDQRLIETLASHVASAFSKIKYSERLRALHSFSLELGTAESVDDVVETTSHIMRDVLGLQYTSFQLLEDEGLVTVGVDGSSGMWATLPLSGKGITTRAAREARTILLGDVRGDPDFIQGSTDSLSELAVPILVEDRLLGVLNVESLQLDAFTVDDARLMEVLAQNVGAALTRIRAAEDKRELERQVLVQQVEVEQEQELGRLKNQFISTATHELRTPITSILGYLELILEDTKRTIPEDIRKDLNVVNRNANRLVTFTNDLLDVQRITSGRFEINREQVDLVNTLNEVVEELTPLFDMKQQVFHVEAPRECIVDVDEIRFSQLLINLLRNANKFTPEEGQIIVTVDSEDSHVQIAVKDTGVGLSVEDIGKLFVPFPEIRHGLGESSTGLGLAICKGIVDQHDGEIWVESEGHGKGSTFYVKLPIRI